jgi:L-asparaginase / beta-aspartyl-peptidase
VSTPAIAVHGGTHGEPPRDDRPHRDALRAALAQAAAALASGGDAVDAACRAVAVLEDAPVCNAGGGSVLHRDGAVEMDAAVMRGGDRQAGAVATVTRVRHPILLAREVMERSPHVLITGARAARLAEEWGLELHEAEWFVTERQRRRWLDRARRGPDAERGTVGAVALDAGGQLAAATSTGGVRDQLPGLVGDSPLVGAGVYAEDGVCAVSATGLGGEAGLIAVDAEGNLAMPFTTEAMFRGCLVGGGESRTAVGRAELS